ncbi:ribosome hibernation-promoting factor, HPF/YfiA family [Candidatus Paracaedibacter symbiosus]|uniref:ribosome hibernation-promoting factor, HPF/YfiA family n=1 Tax=Candidatus Paracaedibacter symbiosus TaxID=244582 RepID=UPI000509A90F|nr:ribosome-associated translation inhibitor RaiA [Candidatus Paracaedibacter symbiosus]
MKIIVSGKNIETGDSLKLHVETAVKHIVDRYFGDILEVHVNFSKDGFRFVTEISFHVSRHFIVRTHCEESDPYRSFDLTLGKIEKRIQRYKSRLRSRSRQNSPEKEMLNISASRYVVDSMKEDNAEADVPLIIAEMNSEIPTVSVSDAVMRMDLTEDTVIMFRNAASGQFNVVYRRQDGNIGWIDPTKA